MKLLTYPFGQIFQDECDDNDLIIDVVYILCMKNRPEPKLGVQALLNCVKEVVLLFGDGIAEWALNYKDSRIRIELVEKTEFYKSFIVENINSYVKFRPDFTIPVKRNYALYDAKNNNVKYVWLLDDDITISSENYISALCALKTGKSVVGFHVSKFPDISTVDHIERIIYKKDPCISMTGSCMFLNIEKIEGYFPNAYNEDLFFYMQQAKPNDVVSGGTISQTHSMPWLCFSRVEHEQFGDFIYNAYKKRFINPEMGLIKWSQEKEVELNRVDKMLKYTSDDIMKNVLLVARKAIRNINVDEVRRFVDDCCFADWVNKYVEG